MDWMYDGMKIQKEDYLLGKKVDKHFNEKADNDSILPPQICPSDNTFSQVDMTKKILEDPLVNIKKREIECTQKMLQNPMRTKKQNIIKPKKHSIEDHQLDMILVSRLKSYEKAGLDLAKILSITKHKEKKAHKRKTNKSSSEDDERSDNYEKSIKEIKHVKQFNHVGREDRKQNLKKSPEYRDHLRNENKSKREIHRSDSSSDDINAKTNKSVNEYKHQRIGHQKYKDNHGKLKRRSVSADQDNNYQSSKKNKYEHHRSISKEKHEYQNDTNSKNKNNQCTEKDNNKNCNDKTGKYEKSKYKQQDNNNREKGYKNNKRYNSESPDFEPERKKQNNFESKNNITEHNKYNLKSNEYHRTNSSDKEYDHKVSNDSKNRHGHYKSVNRRSRSQSPQKEKKYQKTNEIKKDKYRHKFNNTSSSDDEKKNKSKQTSKPRCCSPEFQSDSEKHGNNKLLRKEFGLFVPKDYNVKKSSISPPFEAFEKSTSNIVRPKLQSVKKKKLTDEDMERMRKEMMEDAKIRDKERLSNVKRYRKEDKKEEEKQKPYSKEFLIKQLSHAASQVSVERSIKSNVNKLQKNHSIAD